MADKRTGTATPWLDEIQRYTSAFKPWATACGAINKLYRRENSASKFPILWANVQTLQPAVYARTPKAIVSRRFRDADPVARTAIEVLERACNYTLAAYDFDAIMRQLRDDYLLYARAQPWVRYEPTMRTVPLEDVQTGADPYQTDALEENGEAREDDAQPPESYEEIDFERVIVDYVHRDDFGHSPARTWGEVWCVWRRAYLTRDELVKRFPEPAKDRPGVALGKIIPLDHTPPGVEKTTDEPTRERSCKATVYEIWSKRDRKVFFVAADYPDVLEEVDPFLTLTGFWPCPRPAFGTLTSDSLVPVPDYKFYQDQAQEIDRLTAKIDVLEKALQLVGFHPSGPSTEGSSAIRDALDAKAQLQDLSVKLIPVHGWQSFQEKGGAASITWLPLNHVVEALKAAIELREQIISDVYQITGISDIVRGDTNPNETATAQGIKAQWGSIRIRDRQMELVRLAEEVIRIVGEIIAEKFQPETLQQMTGIPLVPPAEADAARAAMTQMGGLLQTMPPEDPRRQALEGQMAQAAEVVKRADDMVALMELLRNDAQRGFRIEIETDSTIEPDQAQEKQQAIELLGMLGTFFGQTVPTLQMIPQAAPLAGQALLLTLRRFRAGREIEGEVERLVEQISQMQPQQGQGADPAVAQAQQQAAQADAQAQQIKVQAAQATAEATVAKAQAGAQAAQSNAQATVIKNSSAIERAQAEAALRGMNRGLQA